MAAVIVLYESQGLKRGKPVNYATFQIGYPEGWKTYNWQDVDSRQDGPYLNIFTVLVPFAGQLKVLAIGKEATLRVETSGNYEVWM